MKKVILSLLLSLSLITSAFAGMPNQVTATTHRIQMEVTKVDDKGDTTKTGDVCSATAIGPHALLTATHCDLGASTVTIDNGVPTAIADRIVDDSDHTIYIVSATFRYYATFAKSLKIGDEVWLRGNPDGLNQLVRHGYFSGAVVLDGDTYLMFDINGWHGDSGSAIFDKHGEIVAVTSVGFSDGGFVMMGAYRLNFTSEQIEKALK